MIPGGGCYVETTLDLNADLIGWHCLDCDIEDDNNGAGYVSIKAAEDAGEHHRVEVATQELMDWGELP